VIDWFTSPEIRQIEGETLRFRTDGQTELKVGDFFFPLELVEPARKEALPRPYAKPGPSTG
jgi:hypothetical protein